MCLFSTQEAVGGGESRVVAMVVMADGRPHGGEEAADSGRRRTRENETTPYGGCRSVEASARDP